jgi:hypothetical protein
MTLACYVAASEGRRVALDDAAVAAAIARL